jgi:hypothetical protein
LWVYTTIEACVLGLNGRATSSVSRCVGRTLQIFQVLTRELFEKTTKC